MENGEGGHDGDRPSGDSCKIFRDPQTQSEVYTGWRGIREPSGAARDRLVKGQGAYVWDADANQYIDYHAAFAPHFLGHNDPHVTDAVISVLRKGSSLYGSGTTELEGQLAELICRHIPAVESVQFLNTGSEATYQSIRLARAVTGRDHIIVMQGGYNGMTMSPVI